MMISEDFGAFLTKVPGAFVFIGNGASGESGSVPLHNSAYDFNDDVLGTGAEYFYEVAKQALQSQVDFAAGNPNASPGRAS
jgi:hippurate hydrolase